MIAEQLDPIAAEASIDAIIPNKRQPRARFDEAALHDLAASIRAHGVLQPLLVRAAGPNGYELIAGERRLRAARLAGLRRVPIILRGAGDEDSLELALIENLQRQDIDALECAKAYQRLIAEFNLTQEQIADRVGKSRPAIANTLRLLRLPKIVQEGLEDGDITEGHARALLAVEDPVRLLELFDLVKSRKLSVRETEALARKPDVAPAAASRPDPNWEALQTRLAERLGSPVTLRRRARGAGRIVVEFFSDDDLDRLLSTLGLGD